MAVKARLQELQNSLAAKQRLVLEHQGALQKLGEQIAEISSELGRAELDMLSLEEQQEKKKLAAKLDKLKVRCHDAITDVGFNLYSKLVLHYNAKDQLQTVRNRNNYQP